ncbi:hypothetical protein BC628DRAFT_1338239 [Trametes gibbosa]|nr:hypothetical protein BC628DRAFT_1338239 [Trametes gibbosa]
MILPDDTPQSPAKSRAGPPLDDPDEEYTAPPPAYYPGDSSSSRPAVLEARTSSSSAPLLRPQHHIEQVEHAPKRFLRAFAIALLIWFAVASFARSAYSISHSRSDTFPPHIPGGNKGGDHGGHNRDKDPYPPGDGVTLPNPAEGTVKHCVRASAPFQLRGSHIGPTVTFQLPLSADVLYIFSRGSLSYGSVTFTTASGSGDEVQVDISSTYESVELLNKVNLCLFERVPGQKGVGILTPEDVANVKDVVFTINVKFPRGRHGDALRVKAFETQLPLISHHLRDLEGNVHFGSIMLSSRHMSMHSDYLSADVAIVETRNARVSGTYHASRSLILRTTNADIVSDVTLYHDDSAGPYTNFTLLTTNSAITNHLTLRSTSPLSTGGFYDVTADTSNSKLSITASSQPIGSTLLLSARTSNAPASVRLPPAYEGTSVVETTLGGLAKIECDAGAKDPAGHGRTRVCATPRKTPLRVEGYTAWGLDGSRHGMGDVSVVSSNAPAMLMQ